MNPQTPSPPPAKLPLSLAANPKLSSWLKFSAQGQVTVTPGKVEIGQGIVTALAQIAADELDVDISRLQMVRASTATSPNEGVTSGSLSVQQSGRALRHVCAEVRQIFLGLASERLGVGIDALFSPPFDVAVCNFSLLEAELAPVLDALRGVLCARGRLVIQTVHPWVACGDAPHVDGWREETFASFGGGFTTPMPWYFRTLASWVDAISVSRFAIERIVEPADADSGRPLSLLIEATPS